MTVKTSYRADLAAATAEAHARRVDALVASIYVEYNVRNLLVWENVRWPHTRHWRDDCPALRRCKHGRSKLIPKEQVAEGKNCLTCVNMDAEEEAHWAKQQIELILALEPPAALLELPPGV